MMNAGVFEKYFGFFMGGVVVKVKKEIILVLLLFLFMVKSGWRGTGKVVLNYIVLLTTFLLILLCVGITKIHNGE